MAKAKQEKAKGVSVSDTIANIKKKFGDDAIMTLDQKPNVDVDAIPTGSIGLDSALGIGGLPRGRIVEIFGPESSGKTTLALHIIAEAQKRGGSCAFVDAENAMDPQYAQRIGVDIKKLFISQPSCGEEGLQIVDQLVHADKIDVIVVDSVAALTPRAEIEGEIGEVKVGAQARLMSQGMRTLTKSIAESNVLVVFINQIRMNINAMFGANPETTAGGKALKFYTSVRIDVRKIATLKEKDEPVGSRVRAKIVKNKVAAPFRKAEFDIMYNEGISRTSELLTLGEQVGVVDKAGASYKFAGERIGVGFDKTRQTLKEDTELADKIEAAIKSKLNKNGEEST